MPEPRCDSPCAPRHGVHTHHPEPFAQYAISSPALRSGRLTLASRPWVTGLWPQAPLCAGTCLHRHPGGRGAAAGRPGRLPHAGRHSSARFRSSPWRLAPAPSPSPTPCWKSAPAPGSLLSPLSANPGHAVLLCLQNQDEVASKRALFHRQNERGIPESFRATIPYFLGAVPEDQAALQQQLRRGPSGSGWAARRRRRSRRARAPSRRRTPGARCARPLHRLLVAVPARLAATRSPQVTGPVVGGAGS
jgi:hypothetical protein